MFDQTTEIREIIMNLTCPGRPRFIIVIIVILSFYLRNYKKNL